MSYVPVIDASKYQAPAIDLGKARDLGVQGIIVRAGAGLTVDPAYHQIAERAAAAGLLVGAYWYADPNTDPNTTAELFLAAAPGVAFYDLDVELAGASQTQWASWLDRCVNTLQYGGRPVVIYTSATFWNPNVGSTAFGHLPLICARYPITDPPPADAREWESWVRWSMQPEVPRGWSEWDGWQFSSAADASLYGLSGSTLDCNLIRADAWQTLTAVDEGEADMKPSHMWQDPRYANVFHGDTGLVLSPDVFNAYKAAGVSLVTEEHPHDQRLLGCLAVNGVGPGATLVMVPGIHIGQVIQAAVQSGFLLPVGS